MIKKISEIKNFAVFQNFDWDRCVMNEKGNSQEFRAINIIYGRNYSGKTSLSRIFRAFETGEISDKYTNPSFTLNLEDGTQIDQSRLKNHNLTLRVFNEDFVRENLRFIGNPDEDIEPFAVLGEDNNKLEAEIQTLEKDLGSDVPTKETSLYATKVSKKSAVETATSNHRNATQELDRLLVKKATGGPDSIKYKPERFGDQNYNKPKIEKELSLVSESTYQPLPGEKVEELEKLLGERALPEILKLPTFESKISKFFEKAQDLLNREIGKSDKIQELLMDAVLNRWVQEGRTLHKEKRDTCGFCGKTITSNRWAELDLHFDRESEEFEEQLDALISEIVAEMESIAKYFTLPKQSFYTRFHQQFEELEKEIQAGIAEYTRSLKSIEIQLSKRKDTLLQPVDFLSVPDPTNALSEALDKMGQLRTNTNDFTFSLRDEQTDARYKLRLHEVYLFGTTIEYSKKLKAIEELGKKLKEASGALAEIETDIKDKKEAIAEKRRQLNDEEEGARKVNDYLMHYFGHGFLKLESLEKEDPDSGQKRIRFQVVRGGEVAHHLSEGECRLLAFCYFMAKLEDIDTKGVKPILWIDDPISSLDGNHVFFVYSIICDRLIDQMSFAQLFISTHSLDFLKYLRRLPGADNDFRKKEQKRRYQFLIVNRRHNESAVELMPTYMIDYVTEFNHLFHQIYLCSIAEEENDSNYQLFYNFGNNARKFLEMFLFYKFPDSSPDSEKLERFFGQGKIPRFLTDRINNEYSHFSGVFERGALPVVVPEMQRVAKQIIECLERDNEQFKALLNSIGKSPETEDPTSKVECTLSSTNPEK